VAIHQTYREAAMQATVIPSRPAAMRCPAAARRRPRQIRLGRAGAIAQRACGYSLNAGGDKREDRTEGEDMLLWSRRPAMQKKPKQPTGCDGNDGGAHLRPEHLRRLVAAHPRKSECRAGPKDAGQYMQHLGDDEGDLHN
jgi:hypothetical protein